MHEHGDEPRPYTKDDRATVSLLDVCVAKNLPHELKFSSQWQTYNFEVSFWHPQEGFKTYAATRNSRSAAITDAILLMIEKENL
jgi:hypothetical protein